MLKMLISTAEVTFVHASHSFLCYYLALTTVAPSPDSTNPSMVQTQLSKTRGCL